MSPTYEIIYFDGPGRAEAIRVMLHVAGIEFKDTRIAGKDWPEYKPETPLGSMPILKVDDTEYVQSLVSFILKKEKRERGLLWGTIQCTTLLDVFFLLWRTLFHFSSQFNSFCMILSTTNKTNKKGSCSLRCKIGWLLSRRSSSSLGG